MVPSEYSPSSDSLEAREYEQLIQDGITAVKNGNRPLAIKLFEQAAMIDETDVRIWIWMSATTDDMEERRQYLEHAVALDPSNATAKKGLMLLTGKLDKSQLKPEGISDSPKPAPSTVEVTAKTYTCPNCGATISYDTKETTLVCQFCGFTRKIDADVASASKDQPLDAVLPTERAHHWADTQNRVTCEQCGVIILLPPEQTADSCPYCGANRFITPSSQVEMVDPQVIGLFKIEPQEASNAIKSWLGKGWLSPDNLALEHGGMLLHPAYYPFWMFEGTVEIPWFCDVNISTSKLPQWEAHSGSQFENFKNLLIPGLRKLSPADVAGISPFNLDDLVEFTPEQVAGWVALTYDYPLADASLRAREKVVKRLQPSIAGQVELNHQKRNFSTGAGKWSGLTYKLALLPIYMGNYNYQGKRYHLLVNGQTGKVCGEKPMDKVKIALLIVAGVVLLAVVLVVLFFLGNAIIG